MENDFYNINLDIDVKNKSIKSDVDLKYFSKTDNRKKVILYLFYNLNIEYIYGENVKSYSILTEKVEWNPFTYSAQKVKIKLNKSVQKGESVNIKIKYNGVIDKKGVNRIEKEYVELGLYSNWFPLPEDIFKEALFKVNISIDRGYKVVSRPGLKEKDGRYIIRQKEPFGDCTIIASKKLKIIKNTNDVRRMSVYYLKKDHKDVSQKANMYSEWLIDYFLNKFGSISKTRGNVVILPRKEWGGYSRPRLIVLSSSIVDEDELKLFRNIAHEIGHFWWNNAETTSWEDWLNESFAEYSSLMGVRKKFGKRKFKELLKKYKNKNEDLPPIKELDRDDNDAYMTLYCKGPVLLNRLENMIGRDKFEKLLQKQHNDNISSTKQFLKILSEISNKKITNKFNKLLEK